MGTSQQASEWLDGVALEAEYGIPERTWGQWRYLGRGPRYYKTPRKCLYRRRDVEAWLEGLVVDPKEQR